MTAKVCALAGCENPLPPRARRYCSAPHRRAAEAARRAAKRRADAAAARGARQDALIEAMERLGILSAAARQVGVDPSTAYAWARNDPEFAERLEVARLIAYDGHEAHLLAVARAPDPDSLRIRAADVVCRRTDRIEARRRGARTTALRLAAAEPTPEPDSDCGAALEWARLPKLEAV